MAKSKYIKTPEALLDLFTEYRHFIKINPVIISDWVGGMAKKVSRKKERPLTMDGFENYCSEKGFTVCHYFDNQKEAYALYCTVCSRIRKFIRQDQIEGGMIGIYNPSITQRLNGLVEKVQEDGSKEVNINVRYAKKETESD